MSMYGFQDDEVNVKPLNFGLNRGMKLVKFEFNANAGKDNSPQEALDIQFEAPNGGLVNYRQFPVTKAYDKNGNEVTDPNSPEFKKEFSNFNKKITQLVTCFVDKEEYKEYLQSQQVNSFKQFVKALENLIGKDFTNLPPIDIFAQYRWTAPEGSSTKYLEVPKSVTQGKTFTATEEGDEGTEYTMYKFYDKDAGGKVVKFVDGEFVPVEDADFEGDGKKMKATFTVNGVEITMTERKSLIFVSEEGVVHPITRSDWFVGCNWAKAFNDEVSDDTTSDWD